jgi:sugar lactone lactonase YvrE
LFSCGKDSPEHTTLPPVAATNPLPPDSAVDQSTTMLLHWSADRNSSAVTYDLFFGTSEEPPLLKRALKVTHYSVSSLSRAKTYYWRVVSVDPDAGDTPGPLWTFRTAAGSPPDIPSSPYPADGAGIALDHVSLEWRGTDRDQDVLTYDVYAGETDSPPLVAQYQYPNTVRIAVSAGKTYFWRVVARDSYGLLAYGPLWSFHALPVPGHMYNWAGTGDATFGPMGQPPLATNLYFPMDVAFGPDGAPVIADWNNHRVIGLDKSTGHFKLIAGATDGDLGDPCTMLPATCTEIVAAGARLNMPTQVELSPEGKLVICAWHNSEIFLLNMTSGLMDRICGTGQRSWCSDEQPAVSACVDLPTSAAFDSQGRLCFTDQANMVIRMIDGSGTIHTIAGTPPTWNGGFYTYHPGFTGDEGPATSATLNFDRGQILDPSGKICFDPFGNMYIADSKNHAVRVVDTSGIIHRFAGVYPATPGFVGDGGPATAAQLFYPRDVASDANGNIYIADTGNHVVRVVTRDGNINTVAGIPMTPGDGESGGVATETMLKSPYGVAIDGDGNLWIADTQNNRIRVVYR